MDNKNTDETQNNILTDDENLSYEEQEKREDEAYEKALKDFSERLMIAELPSDIENDEFTKYVKKVLGIKCVMAIINHEANLITPLPDSFESPYDPITMWAIAAKNSEQMTKLNEEASKPDDNVYVIMSHSGRASVCCDEFWNELCKKLNTMRLMISMYHKDDDKSFILVSEWPDDSEIDVRTYLHEANKEDESRISYIYVRNVGMLSEASLNSEA